MPRQHRNDPPGGLHHVVNRGVARATVFVDDESRVDFGRRLATIAERHGVEVIAYCLMTNHYHLLLRCPSGGLPEAMQHVSSVFTRHLNDRVGRDGPVFRGRYTSRLITSERYLLNTTRYIHRNPLDIPGVRSIDAYRWSSHRTYLGLRRCPDWLDTRTVLGWFEDPAAFHRFVAADPGQTTGRPDVGEVITTVDFLLRSESADGARVQAGDRRAALLYIAERMPNSETEILERLGVAPGDAERMAGRRAQARLVERPELRSLAESALVLCSDPGLRRAA